MVETIRWRNNRVELIDQRLLPAKFKYAVCKSAKDIFTAIRSMKVRGAPAIGVAAAYGAYLGVAKSRAANFGAFKKELKKTTEYLASSRPTARNLFWALERMEALAERKRNVPIKKLKAMLLEEAHNILKDDIKICRLMGEYGKGLVPKASSVLTHCNAGGLATAGYGTALGVIFSAKGKIKMVYADETRPRLQGARLTAWELCKNKIPVKLICDDMAASIMAKGEIDLVIVGADRVTASGDVANKIGTYNLAVLADYHKIPFYVAAPVSTFDLSLSKGEDIPIEERSPLEVKKIGKECITVKTINVKNPAFDVTPHELVTAIITERGVITHPNRRRVMRVVG